MSKRIVVGLDPSEYAERALEVACTRASLCDGTVIGVGVVDLPGIERASSGAGVGASHFAKKAREHHITEATEKVQKLLDRFKEVCDRYGVGHEQELHSGEPCEALVEVARSADLIVVGIRTFFNFETDQDPGDTLEKLIAEKLCPVMAVPKDLDLPVSRVIFPYDGSASATHSMRIFTSLTAILPVTPDVTLLRVDENVERGLEALKRPAVYLEAYGHKVECKVVPGEPRKVILEVARKTPSSLVVLGASGKSSIRKLFFGSVTRTLLEDGTIPLFIAE